MNRPLKQVLLLLEALHTNKVVQESKGFNGLAAGWVVFVENR
ncbi:MAG: hypothetical protein AB8A46_08205 [Prochlorococcus sp.]|jgi:hypothetical protein|nr:MAG: Uncharacterised protein [Prochlorococcus marinus str. MIT 9215]